MPLVGLSLRLLISSRLNDIEDVIIDEDCCVGANVILLSGTHLKRGCIVGAGAVVNKEYPPYSVVAGVPAKIIASKFTLEQIIKHEQKLYPLP